MKKLENLEIIMTCVGNFLYSISGLGSAAVKSGSSGLKSDGGSGREIEVSDRGGPEVRRRYKSGT